MTDTKQTHMAHGPWCVCSGCAVNYPGAHPGDATMSDLFTSACAPSAEAAGDTLHPYSRHCICFVCANKTMPVATDDAFHRDDPQRQRVVRIVDPDGAQHWKNVLSIEELPKAQAPAIPTVYNKHMRRVQMQNWIDYQIEMLKKEVELKDWREVSRLAGDIRVTQAQLESAT